MFDGGKMTNVEGVYRVEMLGPYGWELFSTSFVQDGHYRGASKDHYSLGTYEVDGENFTMKLAATLHGESRTMFGMKRAEGLKLEFEGTIKKSVILGRVNPIGKKAHTVTFRFTRLSDLNES
jgi:hypothetical protein